MKKLKLEIDALEVESFEASGITVVRPRIGPRSIRGSVATRQRSVGRGRHLCEGKVPAIAPSG